MGKTPAVNTPHSGLEWCLLGAHLNMGDGVLQHCQVQEWLITKISSLGLDICSALQVPPACKLDDVKLT